MAKSIEAADVAVAEPVFSKAQLIGSKKYAKRRDLLAALLKDNGTYTNSEVNMIIKKFMKEVV